jgi:hypothetical protein
MPQSFPIHPTEIFIGNVGFPDTHPNRNPAPP